MKNPSGNLSLVIKGLVDFWSFCEFFSICLLFLKPFLTKASAYSTFRALVSVGRSALSMFQRFRAIVNSVSICRRW